MENNRLSLSLFGRKNTDKKTVSLYITIRVSGVGQKRISTGITLPVENFKNGRITGRSAQIAELQKRVEIIGSQLEKAFWEVYESDVVPTPDSVIAQMERSKNSHMTLPLCIEKPNFRNEVGFFVFEFKIGLLRMRNNPKM